MCRDRVSTERLRHLSRDIFGWKIDEMRAILAELLEQRAVEDEARRLTVKYKARDLLGGFDMGSAKAYRDSIHRVCAEMRADAEAPLKAALAEIAWLREQMSAQEAESQAEETEPAKPEVKMGDWWLSPDDELLQVTMANAWWISPDFLARCTGPLKTCNCEEDPWWYDKKDKMWKQGNGATYRLAPRWPKCCHFVSCCVGCNTILLPNGEKEQMVSLEKVLAEFDEYTFDNSWVARKNLQAILAAAAAEPLTEEDKKQEDGGN